MTTAVVIPSAMSWILASLHVSFGFALVGAVVGEFLGSKEGIGLLISTAQGAFNASGVFAAMIVLAVVALAADFLLTARGEAPAEVAAGGVLNGPRPAQPWRSPSTVRRRCALQSRRLRPSACSGAP